MNLLLKSLYMKAENPGGYTRQNDANDQGPENTDREYEIQVQRT
jgi:hypothetical protein